MRMSSLAAAVALSLDPPIRDDLWVTANLKQPI